MANNPHVYYNEGFRTRIGSEIELKHGKPKLSAISGAYTFAKGLSKEAKPNYTMPLHMFSVVISAIFKAFPVAVGGLPKIVATQCFNGFSFYWQYPLKRN